MTRSIDRRVTRVAVLGQLVLTFRFLAGFRLLGLVLLVGEVSRPRFGTRLCWVPPWPISTVGCGPSACSGSQWMPGTASPLTSSSNRRSMAAASAGFTRSPCGQALG